VCSTSIQPLPLPSPFSDPSTAKENMLQVRPGCRRPQLAAAFAQQKAGPPAAASAAVPAAAALNVDSKQDPSQCAMHVTHPP
jgi:hypothetical protein